MGDLEKLSRLDPDEVFKRTFITPKVLRKLIEGDFAALGTRTKVMGFISILEREFGIELPELRRDAEEFFAHYSPPHSTQRSEESAGEGGGGGVAAALLIGVLAVGGFFYWDHFVRSSPVSASRQLPAAAEDDNSSSALQTFAKPTPSSGMGQEPAQEKPVQQEPVQMDNSEATGSGVQEHNITAEAGVAAGDEKPEETNTTGIVPEENTKAQTGETNETAAVVPSAVSGGEENASVSSKKADRAEKVVILPKRRIWVGVIYLDERKRRSFLTSSPIELEPRDQLIVTGHGFFRLKVDSKVRNYNSNRRYYFLYRDGSLTRIDEREFRKLNGGRSW